MIPTPTTSTLRTLKEGRFTSINLSDAHFSPVRPAAFKTDYLEFLLATLDQIVAYCQKNPVDAVTWSGDVFHLKDPKANTIAFLVKVMRVFSRIEETGSKNFGIAGNHDIRYGNLAAGWEGCPLALLEEAKLFRLLDKQEALFDAGDHTVRLAGGSYHHSKAEHVRDKQKQGATRLVALGHFWFGTHTGEFFGEPLYGPDFFKDSEVDLFIIGHHHEDKGLVNAQGKLFAAPGSITITGAHPHDLQRKPAGTLVESTKETLDVTFLRPKIPAIEDLIDKDRHVQIKEERKELERFTEALAEAKLTPDDPRKTLDELAPPAEVKAKVQQYLEQAEHQAQ